MKADAWGPMWEYNTTKAHPPESEYQVNHKLDDAIKNHPRPSLRALENDRPKSNEHPNASSNGTNGHANAPRFRTLIEGEILGFVDRDNFGRVVQDMGNDGLITFREGKAGEVTKRLPKSLMRERVGSPLRRLEGESESDDRDIADPIGDIDPAAFHGPIGRLALLTQPETEANAVFVLLHLLAFAGATVSRNIHFTVAATRHRLNLFIALIGLSGMGRKGMAGDVAKEIWRRVDKEFAAENITDGLNCSAGLLWHLRDATWKRDKEGELKCTDEGTSDKRRVFLETEFASVLKQGQRENDPMTEYLRKLFDGNDVIRSNVRNDPLKVTGAHVSVIGHCTPTDIEIYLTEADKGNGTANRFLWMFGTRARVISTGGNVFDLLESSLCDELAELREALNYSRDLSVIHRDVQAQERWDEL